MTIGSLEELCELSAELESSAEDYLARASSDATSVRTSWAALQELGWFDLCRDEEVGGLGLPLGVLAGVLRAAGRHLVPGPVMEGTLVAPFIAARVSAESRGLVASDRLLCLVDPLATPLGSPMLQLNHDGEVTGRVGLVPHAASADVLAVVVDCPDGVGIMLVAPDAKGVRIEEREAFAGMQPTADVVLESAPGVLVPLDPGELATLRSWLRVLTAAWLTGVAEQVVTMTCDYVGTREQFGRAVGSFQAVQHMVADMAAESMTMVNLLSMTVARAAEDDAGPSESSALAVKAHAGRTCLRVCESALQMHGGVGFTTDYPLHRYYASALAFRGHYGGPDSLFLQLGQQELVAR